MGERRSRDSRHLPHHAVTRRAADALLLRRIAPVWLQSHCRPPPAAAAQFLVVVAIRIWQQRKIAWYKAGRGAVFVRYRRMGLFREVTPHRPTCAVIAYTDASFWDDAIEFAVRFDPAVFQTAKHRAGRIMTATSVETMSPEGWIASGEDCDRRPLS